MRMRWGVWVAAAMMLCLGAARADDLEDMKRAMEEMKKEMAQMKAEMQAERESMQAAAGGEPEALLSRNKKGTVKIGGEISAGYQFQRTSRADNSHIMDHTSGNWAWRDLILNFGIQMSPTVSGNIKLDLDDNNYDSADNSGLDRLIEEAYITWSDIAKTGINMRVGKQELPFGYDRKGAAWTDPYVHGTTSGTAGANNNTNLNTNRANGSTWMTPGGAAYSTIGEIDNRTALILSYKIPKAWNMLLEGGVFQNVIGDTELGAAGFTATQTTNANGRNWGEPLPAYTPVTGDGRQDDYGFQSFVARVTVKPTEQLTLQNSFVNMHSEAAGRYDYTTCTVVEPDDLAETIMNPTGAKDVYAWSTSAAYDFKCIPVAIYAEYIASWNLNHIRGVQSDAVSFGIDWKPKQFDNKLTLTLLGDYQYISGLDETTDNVAVGSAISELGASRGNTVNWICWNEEHMYRILLAGEYTLKNGLFIGAEVGHEWQEREGEYRFNNSLNGGNPNADCATGDAMVINKDQQRDATRFQIWMGMKF